ncbi:LPS-assembly lipoprotein LptE [Xylophilus sp. ASV27]|uniref:LPS-assembly lipoprotein LptE n=1 Tax=Xylophilus sp. ASV27 TaxID=2795129 RepID=UPI0018EB0934|nr:LPS assembly lipoprotein LptE [Xylophilus sp. ASV27]
MQRRAFASSLVALASAGGLAGCGFHLRQAPSFAFSSIYLASNSAFGIELRRNLEAGGKIAVIRDPAQRDTAQVILDVLQDQRERIVLGYNSAGQVREFQLRFRVRFRLRTPDDRELLPPTEILLQQDQSYDETLALAKEAEAQLIYRNLQTDVVQQIMRRLAAVKAI